MVILINPFEVPASTTDEEFLTGWERAASYLEAQPGFVGTTLHQSLSSDARFRFVNVAEWESPQAFSAAVGSKGFRQLARSNSSPNHPGLYRIVRTAGQPAGTPTSQAREGAPA